MIAHEAAVGGDVGNGGAEYGDAIVAGDGSSAAGPLSRPFIDRSSTATCCIAMSGTVVARRKHGRDLVFCDVQITSCGGGAAEVLQVGEVIQAVFEAQACADRIPCFGEYTSVLVSNAHVEITGTMLAAAESDAQAGRKSLQVETVTLLRCAPDPLVIQKLLHHTKAGAFDRSQAAAALACEDGEIDDLCQSLHHSPNSKEQARVFRMATVQIGHRLAGHKDGIRPSRKRPRHMSAGEREMLDRWEAALGLLQHPEVVPIDCAGLKLPFDLTTHLQDPQAISHRPSFSDGTRREYCHGKKAPQVRWMLQRIDEVLKAACASTTAHQERRWRVLDVGGGRGDLGLSIAAAFRDRVVVTVVDKNNTSLEAGRLAARSLGIDNAVFVCADAQQLETGTASDAAAATRSSPTAANPDLVVGLHTCGGLAHVALRLAVEARAQFIVCPCCFGKHSHLVQLSQCTRRRNQTIGQPATPIDDTQQHSATPSTTPNNIRPHTCVVSMPRPALDGAEFERLCNLGEADTNRDASRRAQMLLMKVHIDQAQADGAAVVLSSFDAAFSARNLVLIGEFNDKN